MGYECVACKGYQICLLNTLGHGYFWSLCVWICGHKTPAYHVIVGITHVNQETCCASEGYPLTPPSPLMRLDMFSLPLPDTASEEIEKLKAVRLRLGSDVLLARGYGGFSAIQAVLVNTLEEGEFHPARAPLAQESPGILEH